MKKAFLLVLIASLLISYMPGLSLASELERHSLNADEVQAFASMDSGQVDEMAAGDEDVAEGLYLGGQVLLWTVIITVGILLLVGAY